MKLYLYTIGLSFLNISAIAQEFNVPYKYNDKYILINQSGTQVLDNIYDELKWINGSMFIGSNHTKTSEPLDLGPDKHSYGRYEVGIIETDLIYNNKVLISKSPFSNFNINEAGIIVAPCTYFSTVKDKASLDKYGIDDEDKIVLFNTKGKQLLPKAVYDTRDFYPIVNNKDTTHYIFLANTSKKYYDAYLYDVKKQAIVQTFLKQTMRTEVVSFNIQKRIFEFMYDKSSNEWERKSFVFNGSTMVPNTNTSGNNTITESYSTNSEGVYYDAYNDGYNDVKVAPPNEASIYGNVTSDKPINSVYYYTMINDTMYSFENRFDHKTAKVIGVNNQNKDTYYTKPLAYYAEGIIRYDHGKCEIITHKKRSGLIYKNAYYIHQNYFVVENEQGKYGILNSLLEATVPIEYDSIHTSPLLISPSFSGHQIKSSYNETTPQEQYKKLGQYIYAYKNDKVDIYDNSFSPEKLNKYDKIYKNVTHFSGYNVAKSVSYIFQSGEEYFAEGRDNNIDKTDIKGPFSGYPLSYYQDYYGIKGKKIYIIFDKEFKFLGYADSNGKLFTLKK